MIRPNVHAGTTSPTLLNRLRDWRDHEAWVEFVSRYDPEIRLACRRYRLDAETTDELCQDVWVALVRRMSDFRYDPGGKFRGWLGRLCHSRALDLLRKRAKSAPVFSLNEEPAASSPEDFEGEGGPEPPRARLLREAADVQDAVRRRVDGRTWVVFWEIAVEGRSVRETSEAAGMTYYAAFAARKRVGRMLREEGQRRLAGGRDESA